MASTRFGHAARRGRSVDVPPAVPSPGRFRRGPIGAGRDYRFAELARFRAHAAIHISTAIVDWAGRAMYRSPRAPSGAGWDDDPTTRGFLPRPTPGGRRLR